MKKALSFVLMISLLGSMTACGSGKTNTNENSDGNSTVSGEIDEIKDYMFVLEVGDDQSFAFPIENGYLEMRGIREDDWVTITYSGELSEVRAFDGELISVEKIR